MSPRAASPGAIRHRSGSSLIRRELVDGSEHRRRRRWWPRRAGSRGHAAPHSRKSTILPGPAHRAAAQRGVDQAECGRKCHAVAAPSPGAIDRASAVAGLTARGGRCASARAPFQSPLPASPFFASQQRLRERTLALASPARPTYFGRESSRRIRPRRQWPGRPPPCRHTTAANSSSAARRKIERVAINHAHLATSYHDRACSRRQRRRCLHRKRPSRPPVPRVEQTDTPFGRAACRLDIDLPKSGSWGCGTLRLLTCWCSGWGAAGARRATDRREPLVLLVGRRAHLVELRRHPLDLCNSSTLSSAPSVEACALAQPLLEALDNRRQLGRRLGDGATRLPPRALGWAPAGGAASFAACCRRRLRTALISRVCVPMACTRAPRLDDGLVALLASAEPSPPPCARQRSARRAAARQRAAAGPLQVEPMLELAVLLQDAVELVQLKRAVAVIVAREQLLVQVVLGEAQADEVGR